MIDNKNAVSGIKAILHQFEENDLLNLAGTVTQGLLKRNVRSRKGAADAILKYSTDVSSFLKRKAVTREILFQYADSRGLGVEFPITKDKLINIILKHWDCEQDRSGAYMKDITRVPSIENATNISSNETKTSTISCRDTIASYSESSNSIQLQRSEIDIMSEKFSEWFYNILNENSMGTEHFYPDASLKLKLYNGNQLFIEEISNHPADIVQLLIKTKQDHNLFFNPNLTKDGTRGKMDPHGLVMINSCGTLHIQSLVSGIFEQMFALARDPFSGNNWKIKNTELVLKSKPNVVEIPTLCDAEFPIRLEIKEL